MKKTLAGLMIFMAFIMATPAFAGQDYHERTFLNSFTDWTITLFKSPQEKQRVTNERIEKRAKWREDRDKRFHGERKTDNQNDNKNAYGQDKAHNDRR